MKILSIKNIVFAILSLVIGAVFIFSAYSKMPTIEQFGWTIVETTFLNWTAAEWVARILIGTEFLLGVLFVSFFRIKKVAIPLSIIMLVIFSLYLILVIQQHGSAGNCGCFGEMIQMTPLESQFKNLILLLAIVILYFIQNEWRVKYDKWILVALSLICLVIPFLIAPPDSIFIYEKDKIQNKPIPLSILYHSTNNKAPNVELRKGKHVFAFMSMTCEYCRKAAKRMRIMKEKHSSLPFYIILNGDSSSMKAFFDDTKATNIPFTHFNGVEQFVTLAGGHGLPVIRWVSDTTLYKETNYLNLDEHEVMKWMND